MKLGYICFRANLVSFDEYFAILSALLFICYIEHTSKVNDMRNQIQKILYENPVNLSSFKKYREAVNPMSIGIYCIRQRFSVKCLYPVHSSAVFYLFTYAFCKNILILMYTEFVLFY